MAAFSGTAGSVGVSTNGATLVGGIAEWSLDFAMPSVESTEFGDTFDDYVPSVRNMTGSFSGNRDSSDSGQTYLRGKLEDGTKMTFAFYLNATSYFSGTAFLTGLSPTVSVKGKADISYNFTSHDTVLYT